MPSENLKDKTAKGFFWGALNTGAMQVLNAVFGIVLARLLAPEDYGLIGMLTIFTLIANSLQDSGFVPALTNKRNATHNDYNSVFWFNVSVSLLLYILLFFCAPLIATFFREPILTSLSRYYFLSFVVASFNIVPRAILFRQLKQKELAIMSIISLTASGTVGIIMAFGGMAYWGLATQTLTFNLMVTIFSWIFSRWKPRLPLSEWRKSPDVWAGPIREMFGFSSKMLITNIFIHINNNIFSIVLGKLYTKLEVGTYTQANKWNTMGASTITGMVQGVAQPTFVEVGDDLPRLRRAFSKMLRFTSFIAFPIMFGLALVAPEFIDLLLGDKWLPSAHLMQILCVGGAFLPIATLYMNLIISRGKSDVYMWNVIAQGCAILGSIILVHCIKLGIRNEELGMDTLSIAEHTIPNSSFLIPHSITLMVLSYVLIIILWTGIWHRFLYQEIRYPFLSALKDILPFLLIAAAAMAATYFITSTLLDFNYQLSIINYQFPTLLTLLSRILIAALLYLGTLWLLGAKILKESIGYLLKKKSTKG